MKITNQRRVFLKHAGVVSLGFMGLSRCSNVGDKAKEDVADIPETVEKIIRTTDYGPLLPDPEKYLDLPKGFSYKIISRKGDQMDDGFFVPGAPDAMGTFPLSEDRMVIIRNHELRPEFPEGGPFGAENKLLDKISAENFYDAGKLEKPCLGGTTTMIYNEATGMVEKQFLSLAGTIRNCAGGVTPWGSWITCEEDMTRSDGVLEKDHGFNFEVPVTEDIALAEPVPLTDMGRFNHEAVCVDPNTSIVYETEDRGNSLFYRFIPNTKEKLRDGGKLQALVIKGSPGLDTRNWENRTMNPGQEVEVEWIDMDNILSPEDDLRIRGREKGAAIFARGEGIWFGDNELYFACSSGGPTQLGQIFKYVPSPYEGTDKESEAPGKLTLFAESKSADEMKMCDNITVAPFGNVIVCEDNGEKNRILGILPDGRVYQIGLNVHSSSEFAGAVFSPSGKTLFVNIQGHGHTLAITGPWV